MCVVDFFPEREWNDEKNKVWQITWPREHRNRVLYKLRFKWGKITLFYHQNLSTLDLFKSLLKQFRQVSKYALKCGIWISSSANNREEKKQNKKHNRERHQAVRTSVKHTILRGSNVCGGGSVSWLYQKKSPIQIRCYPLLIRWLF